MCFNLREIIMVFICEKKKKLSHSFLSTGKTKKKKKKLCQISPSDSVICLMTGILFNEYKGYCVPRGTKDLRDEQLDEILTDGFDSLDWGYGEEERNDQSDDHKNRNRKRKKNILYGTEEFECVDIGNGIYGDESKTHMNHDTGLKRLEEIVGAELSVAGKKIMSKRQQRLAQKSRKSSKKNTKKKNKDDCLDYNQPSDSKKIQVLNRIYSEIVALTNKPKSDDKVLQFFDVSIYKDDIDNMKDDEWLNDNNLSFIYEYLERYLLSKYSKLVSSSILLLRPSMVYLLAQVSNPAELKGVIPPLESPSVRFIFLPINDNDDIETPESGSHWSLVLISLLDNTAYVYDTMERANEKEALAVIEKVTTYLNNGKKFRVEIIEKTPQQINGSDCGMMVCQLSGVLLSRMLNLEHLKDNCMNFQMDNVSISAIDGRIFVLGSILNILKHKLGEKDP